MKRIGVKTKDLSEKYEWYVVFDHDCSGGEKGDIYSRHAAYDNARSSAKKSGFDDMLCIKNYQDMVCQ